MRRGHAVTACMCRCCRDASEPGGGVGGMGEIAVSPPGRSTCHACRAHPWRQPLAQEARLRQRTQHLARAAATQRQSLAPLALAGAHQCYSTAAPYSASAIPCCDVMCNGESRNFIRCPPTNLSALCPAVVVVARPAHRLERDHPRPELSSSTHQTTLHDVSLLHRRLLEQALPIDAASFATLHKTQAMPLVLPQEVRRVAVPPRQHHRPPLLDHIQSAPRISYLRAIGRGASLARGEVDLEC